MYVEVETASDATVQSTVEDEFQRVQLRQFIAADVAYDEAA